MRTAPSISSYLISAIAAAFVAAGVFAAPSALVSTDQLPLLSAQAIVDATTGVDRAPKGDRLPVSLTDPAANTTIVAKSAGSSGVTIRGANGTPAQHKIIDVDDGTPAPKSAPAPLVACEAVASPIADPTLSRFVGRCFV